MLEEVINIDNILALKIHANTKAFDDINDKFVNITNDSEKIDYELFYNKTSKIKRIEFGTIMHPFRNANYIVNRNNDRVFAYSSNQRYTFEHTITRDDKTINIDYIDDLNSQILKGTIIELLIRKLLEQGYFPVHSSSVVFDDKSTIYIGGKNGGKSASLLYDVLNSNGKPQSNDITFIKKDSDEWVSFGIPYDFTFSDSFLQALNIKNMDRFKTIKYDSDKIRFNVKEFCNIFNTQWIWKTKISNINIVNLNKENDYCLTRNVNKNDSMLYLKKFGKDRNFNFDDYLMINNIKPNYNYDELVNDFDFNLVEGNIIKKKVRR